MIFQEFKQECEIKNVIMDYLWKENEFSIYIYCLEKNIDFVKEKMLWNVLWTNSLGNSQWKTKQ